MFKYIIIVLSLFQFSCDQPQKNYKTLADDLKLFSKTASAKMGDGDYQGAILALNQAYKVNPKSSEIYFLALGFNYFLLENYDEAIRAFGEVLEINPLNIPCYNFRSDSFGFLKQYDNQIDDLIKSIELDPKGRLFSDTKAFGSYYYEKIWAKKNYFDQLQSKGCISDTNFLKQDVVDLSCLKKLNNKDITIINFDSWVYKYLYWCEDFEMAMKLGARQSYVYKRLKELEQNSLFMQGCE